jgi:hypothetical protein
MRLRTSPSASVLGAGLSLGEVALALAAQDGSPLADRPDPLARAAAEATARHPDADA